MKLNDLLEHLYTAHDSFTSVQVTWQYWYLVDLLNEVLANWAIKNSAYHVAPLKTPKEPHAVKENKILRKVWWEKPSCWREEQMLNGESTATKIILDDRYWTFDSLRKKLITNVAPQGKHLRIRKRKTSKRRYIPTVEDALKDVPLLDPSFLLVSHALQPLEDTTFAGREALQVRATYKKGKDLIPEPFFWAAADEFEILVDKERGILLRYEARWKGRAFAISSVDSVVFDEPIPENVFSFTPPDNTSIELVY